MRFLEQQNKLRVYTFEFTHCDLDVEINKSDDWKDSHEEFVEFCMQSWK